MLLQHLLEIPTRVTSGMLGYLLWSARHDDLSSLVSPFWAEIHDPVGTTDHIEVVLDHQEDGIQEKSLTRKRHQHQPKKFNCLLLMNSVRTFD
jgi:hypothetical protein